MTVVSHQFLLLYFTVYTSTIFQLLTLYLPPTQKVHIYLLKIIL